MSALLDPIGDAVRWLCADGLLAYPTETVWGLGADAGSEAALESLRAWKGRGSDAPVSLLVESLDAAREAGFALSPMAERLAARFWPGPLTLVVATSRRFAPGVAREDGAVGLRCSSHPLARALARRMRKESEGLVTATSLNRSGEPPATCAGAARALCGEASGEPHLLEVEGAEAGGEEASTVVDAVAVPPRVLRWGALGPVALEPTLEEWA